MKATASRAITAAVQRCVWRVELQRPTSLGHLKSVVRTVGRGYVWRGQREDLPLLSSFDRACRLKEPRRREVLNRHLRRFLDEMEARHSRVLQSESEEGAWAVGQHYGLKTPLLDWTRRPEIAAYFALEQPSAVEGDQYRYVYGLKRSLRRLLRKSKRAADVVGRDRFVRFIDQGGLWNPRFSAQAGVLSLALNGDDIETNVTRWSAKRPEQAVFAKFAIPTEDRDHWLHDLERVGVHRSGLGPDLADELDLRNVINLCNADLDRMFAGLGQPAEESGA